MARTDDGVSQRAALIITIIVLIVLALVVWKVDGMKIIVGASPNYHIPQEGWLSLKQSDLDITDAQNWRRLFAPASLDAILAEHVFEHLEPCGAVKAAGLCYQYLKRGGYLRIAVPDGLHTQAPYIEWVRPQGTGEKFLSYFRTRAEVEHKILFNYQTLARLLRSVGFRVRLLEWFDERGQFHKQAWRSVDGDIRLAHGRFWSETISMFVGAQYTSLIVDAVKLSK